MYASMSFLFSSSVHLVQLRFLRTPALPPLYASTGSLRLLFLSFNLFKSYFVIFHTAVMGELGGVSSLSDGDGVLVCSVGERLAFVAVYKLVPKTKDSWGCCIQKVVCLPLVCRLLTLAFWTTLCYFLVACVIGRCY